MLRASLVNIPDRLINALIWPRLAHWKSPGTPGSGRRDFDDAVVVDVAVEAPALFRLAGADMRVRRTTIFQHGKEWVRRRDRNGLPCLRRNLHRRRQLRGLAVDEIERRVKKEMEDAVTALA